MIKNFLVDSVPEEFRRQPVSYCVPYALRGDNSCPSRGVMLTGEQIRQALYDGGRKASELLALSGLRLAGPNKLEEIDS